MQIFQIATGEQHHIGVLGPVVQFVFVLKVYVRKCWTLTKAKKSRVSSNGFGTLENGVQYIEKWPSHQRPVDLNSVPDQTLFEAADWCVVAACLDWIGNQYHTNMNTESIFFVDNESVLN